MRVGDNEWDVTLSLDLASELPYEPGSASGGRGGQGLLGHERAYINHYSYLFYGSILLTTTIKSQIHCLITRITAY